MQLNFEFTSSLGNLFKIEILISDDLKQYWIKDTSLKIQLYQQLSHTLINQPYADEPDYKIKHGTTIIYHPNHDTSHSIRQAQYSAYFLSLIQTLGLPAFQSVSENFTPEELACFELAAFLLRVGRSNERDGLADTSNQKRSASLFQAIGLALGFNTSLVEALAYCVEFTYQSWPTEKMMHHASAFSGDRLFQTNKLALMKQLLHLCHHIDLVRCFADINRIEPVCQSILTNLIDAKNLKPAVIISLNYARACCALTGTPYYQHQGNYERYIPPRLLKAQTLTDIALTWEQIKQTTQSFQQAVGQLAFEASNNLLKAIEQQQVILANPQQTRTIVQWQRRFFAKRAHRETKEAVLIDPPSASISSLNRLRRDLAQGLGLSAAEMERKKEAILLPEEQVLYDYLVNEFLWTLKHITPGYERIQQDGNTLKSLHQRNRENRFNDVCFTSDVEGRSDNIHATLSGPDGWPADFLKTVKGHEIRSSLRDFVKDLQVGDKLTGLWFSSTWYGYVNQLCLKSLIATTVREIKYVKSIPSSPFLQTTDYKQYTYKRENGEILTRQVRASEEVASAGELLPFLAFHIILELRMVGGEYRQSCLQERPFKIIEPFIDTVFEVSNFEALLPSRLNLNDKRITIQPFNQHSHATPENAKRFLEAVEQADFAVLDILLNEGVPVDIDCGNRLTPLGLSLSREYISDEVAKWLIHHGANTQLNINGYPLLAHAAMHRRHSLVSLILETGIVDKRDKRLKRLLDINEEVEAISIALNFQDREMLGIFLQHGLDLATADFAYLKLIISLPELAALNMLAFLESVGFNSQSMAAFSSEQHYELLKSAIISNKVAIIERLLALGIDPAVKTANQEGMSLFEQAQQQGNPQISKLFINSKTKTDSQKNSTKRRVLHILIEDEEKNIIIAKKRRVDGTHATYFTAISSVGLHEKYTQYSLFKALGIRIEPPEFEELASVEFNEHQEIVVKATLKQKIQPIQTQEWAQCQWVALKDVPFRKVNAIIKHAASSAHNWQQLLNNQQLLITAIKEDQLDKVNAILQEGVIDGEQNALLTALDTKSPNLAIINALLSNGYEVNTVFKLGEESLTPLMLAIIHHRRDLMALLLSQGANINQQVNQLMITPVLLAAELDQLDTVTFLVNHGALFTHPANQAILAYVCTRQCSDTMFDYLLEHADLDAKHHGYTPLMLVSLRHHHYRIEALLKKGANQDIKDPIKHQVASILCADDKIASHIFDKYRDKSKTIQSKPNAHVNAGYLKLTGKIDCANLQERILEEYDIAPLPASSVLSQFLQQLLMDSGYKPGEDLAVELMIAHSGNLPVFTCHGLEKPVIAIHKDFLLGSTTHYQQVCFAVAHELNYIKKTNYEFIFLSATDRIACDEKAMDYCQDAELLIRYLQFAARFFFQYNSQHNFHWPFDYYPFSLDNKKYFFDDRVKAIRLLLIHKQVQTGLQPNPINPDIRQAVQSLPQKRYYHVTKFTSKEEQYDYLIQQLPTLADELLPMDISDVPSMRLKEFAKYLRNLPPNEKKLDQLFEHIVDLRLPCFKYLYLTVCQLDNFEYFEILENGFKWPLFGYLKKMHQAMRALLEADDLTQAMKAHETIMALYPHVVEHGAHGQYISKVWEEIKKAISRNAPFQRLFGSHLNLTEDWPQFSHKMVYRKHLEFANQAASQGCMLWKSLWIMGMITTVELYPLLPSSALMALGSGDRELGDPPDDIIPRPIIKNADWHNLSSIINAYFTAQKKPDITMLKGDFASEWPHFISANYLYFVPKEGDKHNNPATNDLLANFSKLAIGDTRQQQAVRDFFLSTQPYSLSGIYKNPFFRNISVNSIYIQFVFKFHTLFTPYEMRSFLKKFVSVNEIGELPMSQLLELFRLNNIENQPLTNQLALMNNMFSGFEGGIINSYLLGKILKSQNYLLIFSLKTIQLLDFLNSYHPVNLMNHWKELSLKLEWQPVHTCQLTVEACIKLYRILDRSFAFPTQAWREEFGELILKKIARIPTLDERLVLLEALIFIKHSASGLSMQDRVFFKQVAQLWVIAIKTRYGLDQGSASYAYRMKQILERVYYQARHTDALYLFEKLAVAIESQYLVSLQMENLLNPQQNQYQISQKLNNFSKFTDLFGLLNTNTEDKQTTLDFIAAPLSQQSLQVFAKYICKHPKYYELCTSFEKHKLIEEDQLIFPLSSLHQNFWDLKLMERALLLDSLIITKREETSENAHKKAYLEGFDYTVKKLFPQASTNAREGFALALLRSYMEEADNNERQFLLAALLVTSNSSSSNAKQSIGRKLALMCEHLGPAYVKLAQAIHSHPDTPADIKQDLSHVKSRANPPYRWELWRLISKVLPTSSKDAILHLGHLLGSASYHLALEYVTQAGESQVLLLLRENAASDAKKGFAHLNRTVLACTHPLIEQLRQLFLNLIQEAEEMSHAELDNTIADQQQVIAARLYHGDTLQIVIDKIAYQVNFEATRSLNSGPGYRVLTRMRGCEFNQLTNQPQLSRIIALAVIEKELSLLFSGDVFDSDRHGNQLCIEALDKNITLGLYDFGEMSLEPLTETELASLSALMEELPKTLFKSGSVASLFEKHIRLNMEAQQPHRHLMRINKALLALEDFRKYLTIEDLKHIFTDITPKMHPKLRDALLNGMNKIYYADYFSAFFNSAKKQVTEILAGVNEGVECNIM